MREGSGCKIGSPDLPEIAAEILATSEKNYLNIKLSVGGCF
jgi:hypothetical protein